MIATIITYTDSEDASCPGDPVTAGTFPEIVKQQQAMREMLEKQGFDVIFIPFDRNDYHQYLAHAKLTDTRANRSAWATTKCQ